MLYVNYVEDLLEVLAKIKNNNRVVFCSINIMKIENCFSYETCNKAFIIGNNSFISAGDNALCKLRSRRP